MRKIALIIVSGASGSGKTTVSELLKSILQKHCKVAILNQDNFYNDINCIPKDAKNQLNFDHPEAFDWNKINHIINEIITYQKNVTINKYDFTINAYTNEIIEINNIDVLIFEGIYALYNKDINKLADLKIFIHTDLDECLIRRIQRDVYKRGRSIDSIIEQWRNSVKPMYTSFIKQTEINADVIIPWSQNRTNIIELVSSCIIPLIKNNK